MKRGAERRKERESLPDIHGKLSQYGQIKPQMCIGGHYFLLIMFMHDKVMMIRRKENSQR